MFGGEIALRLYFDALAFVDGLEQLWREDIGALLSPLERDRTRPGYWLAA